MREYYYLVLFKNGTMLPWGSEPSKKAFAAGARFFRVDETVTILDLGEWYGRGNQKTNLHAKPSIVEIEPRV